MSKNNFQFGYDYNFREESIEMPNKNKYEQV